jgi:hypothetical protein
MMISPVVRMSVRARTLDGTSLALLTLQKEDNMRRFISTALVAASLSFAAGTIPVAYAGETVVEKKVTTTSPSGVVVIENEASRTFKLQGHTEVYTAPAGVDLKSYSGKEVSVSLNPDGSVTKVEKKTTVE